MCTTMHLSRCIWILQMRESSYYRSGRLSKTRFVKQNHVEDVVHMWDGQILGLGHVFNHDSHFYFARTS